MIKCVNALLQAKGFFFKLRFFSLAVQNNRRDEITFSSVKGEFQLCSSGIIYDIYPCTINTDSDTFSLSTR